jgi:uridylate kinase
MNETKKRRRVLLKLSGEALLGPNATFPYDANTMMAIAKEIAEVHQRGVEIAIVVGGGNIFRGAKGEQAGMDRTLADHSGMLATVINGIAILDLLERKYGTKTRLVSGLAINEVAEPYIRRKAVHHLEQDRVIIFVGGTGNPFFTTDTAAALRACEIKADLVAKATNIDGIYDKDPKKYPGEAKLHKKLTYDFCTLNNLKVMDPEAFTLCRDNNIPIRVFSLNMPGNIVAALTGEDIGSLVSH